jgi:hypothetical protein
MLTVTGILGISAAVLMAASSWVFLNRSQVPTPAPSQKATVSIIRPAGPAILARAQTPAIKIKTRVLILKQAILDDLKITFNATIPGHHVRPEYDDTDNGITVLEDDALQNLLEQAQSDPQTHLYQPQPLELADNQDEFDCLSAPYRDPPANLTPELSSALINGVSLAYTPVISPDRHAIIFTPISVKRADLSASDPASKASFASRSAKPKPVAKVTVPNGRTLAIDAGPIKAKPSQSKPSHHMLVLLKPTLADGKVQ